MARRTSFSKRQSWQLGYELGRARKFGERVSISKATAECCNMLHITLGSLDMKGGGRVRKLDQRFSVGKENAERRNVSTINLGSLGGKVGKVMSFLSAKQNCREPCLLRK